MKPALRLAIDGNEANTQNRVGSNVYAFELLRALSEQVEARNIDATVLLSAEPSEHLPVESANWHYLVIKPSKYWTQWAAPLYLDQHKADFDLFFTPSHYAPRGCAIPYVSSVMDTAYVAYPAEFKLKDRMQLTNWTAYSVKHAKKVIAISQFTKRCIQQVYGRSAKDIVVAYPGVRVDSEKISASDKRKYLQEKNITDPFFLYVGTIQPRKRLSYLIEAFEQLSDQALQANSRYRPRKGKAPPLPQLVIAGKVGWLAAPIVARVNQSRFVKNIRMLGYISNQEKQILLQQAKALVLIGRHEGFGIPPLEAMQAGTIPIVARTGSLTEVVGPAGMLVAADDSLQLVNKMSLVLSQTARERATWVAKGHDQVKLFSWENSADIVLDTLESCLGDTA
jgi:glycosyltransferase involved in cell wall biosynthesis